MKIKVLFGILAAVLLVGAGCSTTVTTNTNLANTANKAATPAATPASTTTSPTPASSPSSPAGATEGSQDFTLHNETGVEIDQLYVSPHDKDDWGADILGRDTLPSGQTVNIIFNPKEKAAVWDLKITAADGSSIEWENLNLMEISEVTLRYANGKGTAEVK